MFYAFYPVFSLYMVHFGLHNLIFLCSTNQKAAIQVGDAPSEYWSALTISSYESTWKVDGRAAVEPYGHKKYLKDT